MPDISMCRNEECPLHKDCYRFNATPSPMIQPYGLFDYDKGCDYYWPMEQVPVSKSEHKRQKLLIDSKNTKKLEE